MMFTPAALSGSARFKRRLSAKLHDHAHRSSARSFVLANGEHVFQGQRLEVEAITGVVIGRDRFRIAVDHDGLVTIVAQRKRRVAATVVKLDSLPDAIRPAAQNDHFLLVGRRGLVFFFVGRVKIRRIAFEFGGAGVHAFVNRRDAVLLAQMPDFFLRPLAVASRQTPARRPSEKPMRLASRSTSVGIDSMGCFSSSSCMSLISLSWYRNHGSMDVILRQLLDRVALAQGIADVGKPLGMRRHQSLGENLRLDLSPPLSSFQCRASARL